MIIGSDKWRKILRDGSAEMGAPIGKAEMDRLSIHAVELMKFNEKINLTAITDPMKVAVNHYLDSLAALRWVPPKGRLLDIGSGGGFPGIPLKVMLPDLTLVLIDSSRKKITFLKHAIRVLRLDESEAHHIRAQELAEKVGFAGSFDVVVSRALSTLKEFFYLALPFVGIHGRMIAWKGGNIDEELGVLEDVIAGQDIVRFSIQIQAYSLPSIQSERSLVILSVKHEPLRDRSKNYSA